VNDHHSASEQRRQLTLIVTAFGLLTLAGTVGFMLIEGWSAIDAGVSMAVYIFTRLGQFVLAGELLEVLGRRRMKSELEKLEQACFGNA
jgi:hypothetical protein